MGALAFEPALGAATAPQDWSLLALAQEVQGVQQEAQRGIAGQESAALAQLVLLGGSPQGARPKVLVNVDAASGTVSASPLAAGTPGLVKFAALGEHPEVCAIEALYATLAAECGIQVPATRYFAIRPKCRQTLPAAPLLRCAVWRKGLRSGPQPMTFARPPCGTWMRWCRGM